MAFSCQKTYIITQYLQLIHIGETMDLRKINGSSDGNDLGVKLIASKSKVT